MREFITAAKEASEDEDERDSMIEFKVDGVVCFADKEPGDGQLALFMASTAKNSVTNEMVAGTINFFFGCVDDDTRTYLAGKLMDRKDPFGLTEIQEILHDLIEEWSGRPTVRSSASTSSRKPAGRKSTRRTPELTSSDSQATAS
jgi:hypothetical protein